MHEREAREREDKRTAHAKRQMKDRRAEVNGSDFH